MDPMMTSLQGLGSFLAYFGAAVLAEAVFLALYMRVTPHDEAKLIGAGNAAAAISLGGAMLGFTLPVASAVAVGSTPRPVRSNSGAPSCFSSPATCRLSVGCVRPSLRAAADKEPVSAVSRKALSWFQSS